MEQGILHLGKPTDGDDEFYSRWEKIGKVFTSYPNNPSEITILVVDFRIDVTTSFLKAFPNLKYVCSPTTGHTHLKFNPSDMAIKVITLKGERSFLSEIRSVSEFTIKQMLNLCRSTNGSGTLLYRKKIGIIGFGRIGKQVASLCMAFGMQIKPYDKENKSEELLKIFKESDFISVHLEENPTTKNFVSRELIMLMKPTSFLINTSRPSIVDENYAAYAARYKKIKGFATDFTDSAILHKGPNIIITNHIAGNTLDDRIRTDEFIIEKLSEDLRRTSNN